MCLHSHLLLLGAGPDFLAVAKGPSTCLTDDNILLTDGICLEGFAIKHKESSAGFCGVLQVRAGKPRMMKWKLF